MHLQDTAAVEFMLFKDISHKTDVLWFSHTNLAVRQEGVDKAQGECYMAPNSVSTRRRWHLLAYNLADHLCRNTGTVELPLGSKKNT